MNEINIVTFMRDLVRRGNLTFDLNFLSLVRIKLKQ